MYMGGVNKALQIMKVSTNIQDTPQLDCSKVYLKWRNVTHGFARKVSFHKGALVLLTYLRMIN